MLIAHMEVHYGFYVKVDWTIWEKYFFSQSFYQEMLKKIGFLQEKWSKLGIFGRFFVVD